MAVRIIPVPSIVSAKTVVKSGAIPKRLFPDKLLAGLFHKLRQNHNPLAVHPRLDLLGVIRHQ